jgi:hypothetical protein
MPEHYAVFEVGALLLVAQQTYRRLKCPLNGFIQDVYYNVGSNLPSDATFNIRKNGTSIWAGDLTQRPKILSGQSSGNKLAINTAVAVNDRIEMDVDVMPAGGLPVPFFTSITFYDTIGLRSTIIYTTASLADLAEANIDIPNMGRGWELIKATADRACWLRGYVSAAARTADVGRSITTEATENVGLCAEIIFTSPNFLDFNYGAPFPTGFNLDNPNSLDGLFRIQNRSGATSTVQLTLIRLIKER